ncbi:MAG: heat-inducible transcription repressor HrcA [Clostridia bacterium]|nr:heat-inducible transcription repressor HrcA [Clostridia bacterium]
MKMDDRKFLILQAIIDDYIMTAVPVGSRTISRKSGVGFSPATIRNEMSDLEELGYLAQPHTSAGRIPSAKAYRLYVDRLMKMVDLSEEETGRIRDHLNRRTAQVEEVIRQAAQALSDVTHYTAVVAGPQMTGVSIKRVQMVPVTDTSALLVIVTSAGLVKERVIQVPEGVGPDQLYGLSKMLTERLSGCSPQEAREQLANVTSDLGEHSGLMAGVLGAIDSQLDGDQNVPLVVGGRSNLLHYPEYSDVEKARSFLAVLESREKLAPLLKGGNLEFTVRIGPEINMPEFSDCSVVTATYHVGENTSGTMGIIGPTRMDYARVVSVMNYMGRAISDLLSGVKE